MKKHKWGITAKMFIAILIPVCLVLIGITGVTHWLTRQAIDNRMKSEVRQQTMMTAEVLNGPLKEAELSLKLTADILNQQERSDTEIRNILRTVKTSNPSLLNAFVGYDGGKIIAAVNDPAMAGNDAGTRPWYQAVAGDEAVVSELHEITPGKTAVTISYPLKLEGSRVGVIGFEFSLDQIAEMASAVKIGQTGYVFMIDRAGHFVYHPTNKPSESIFTIANGTSAKNGSLYLSGNSQFIRFAYAGVPRVLSSSPVGNSGMAVILSTAVSEYQGEVDRLTGIIIILSIIGLAILAVIVFVVVRKTTKTMGVLSEQVGRLAAGDFTLKNQREMNLADDELGRLYKSIKAMFLNIRSLVANIQQTAEQVAASSQQLTASAEQSSQAAVTVANSISDVAGGAGEQLVAINDTFDAVEKMSGNIQQIAVHASAVAGQSAQAENKAKSGDESVSKAVSQMVQIEQTVNTSARVVTQLGDRSKEIGQIIDTIAGIAGQTNLLALNAAIEAARAGEQGKGFAVVAEEVRNLAEQSQKAAKQIAVLIGQIQEDTDKAIEAMNNGTREVRLGAQIVDTARQDFQEISNLTTRVSHQVKEISGAIDRLADGSQQIVSSVHKLDELSKRASGEAQTVSAATEEQSASMGEIASSSQSLAKMAQELREAAGKFEI